MLRHSRVRRALHVLTSADCWRTCAPVAMQRWTSTADNAHSGSSSDATAAMQWLREAAAKNGLAGVFSVVEEAGESFDGCAVEASLQQVESCTHGMTAKELTQLHQSKTFQMLADMAVSSAADAPPEVLASTIGVLGRLQFADEMVLDSLARHLMPNVGKLNPEQLASLVEGLRGADHSPSVLLLDEVHERLSNVQQHTSNEQVEAINEGLEALGRDEDNPPNAKKDRQPERINSS